MPEKTIEQPLNPRVSWWWSPSVLLAGIAARHIAEQWITSSTVLLGLVFLVGAGAVFAIAKSLTGTKSRKTAIILNVSILMGSLVAMAVSNEAFIKSRIGAGTAAQHDSPAPYVARTWSGSCPAGYVDHPVNPAQCALPIVAQQILDRPRQIQARREARRARNND